MREKEFYDFIESNASKEPYTLRLNKNKKERGNNFDRELAITQIECRRKKSHKFKDILENKHFLFPDSLSFEQASHQAVARFHSSLVKETDSILDMTAGLGIDSIYFSRKAKKVTAVELDPHKAAILKENCGTLKIGNLDVHKRDSIEFLKVSGSKFDIIFIDPSRRDELKNRVYNLRDCSPDILENQSLLFQYTERILIKASPLLDISQTLRDFRGIRSIKAVGVKGECKELLIELRRDCLNKINNEVILEAVNLDNEGNILSHYITTDSLNYDVRYAKETDIREGKYILEPSAMLMKLASWGDICKSFDALKLGKSSNLFIADRPYDNFPGRTTKIIKELKKQDRKSLSGVPATVISKNYPLTSEELRKNLKIKEGDNLFIYASRLGDKPILLLSESISH